MLASVPPVARLVCCLGMLSMCSGVPLQPPKDSHREFTAAASDGEQAGGNDEKQYVAREYTLDIGWHWISDGSPAMEDAIASAILALLQGGDAPHAVSVNLQPGVRLSKTDAPSDISINYANRRLQTNGQGSTLTINYVVACEDWCDSVADQLAHLAENPAAGARHAQAVIDAVNAAAAASGFGESVVSYIPLALPVLLRTLRLAYSKHVRLSTGGELS